MYCIYMMELSLNYYNYIIYCMYINIKGLLLKLLLYDKTMYLFIIYLLHIYTVLIKIYYRSALKPLVFLG